jgi:hypothetical protein
VTDRRSQSLARLDALLEILGPAWHAAIGGDLANRTPVKFLAAGYADPHVVKRLGRTRLARFCYRHSRGAWGEPHADALLAAAQETLQLWSRLGSELAVEKITGAVGVGAWNGSRSVADRSPSCRNWFHTPWIQCSAQSGMV